MKQARHTEIKVTVVDDAGVEVDVSAAQSADYQLAASVNSATPIISKTLGNGIALAGAVATVTLDATATDQPEGIYHHELKIVDQQGRAFSAMSELVEVIPTLIN